MLENVWNFFSSSLSLSTIVTQDNVGCMLVTSAQFLLALATRKAQFQKVET